MDLPPFNSSAMDGFALVHAEQTINTGLLQIAGESLAGHPFRSSLSRGQCIRITTGAMVPACVDTVIPLENCTELDGRLQINELSPVGANIRAAGNDISKGTTLHRAGHQLTQFDIAWLAACGITEVDVYRRPRVAIFSTGDELCEPGMTLAEGQIYDSNREVLRQLLDRLPVVVTDLGIINDDRAALEAALVSAAKSHDLILTSGGVSVGSADFLKDVVAALGSLDLWRLNLKPGKPLACGRIGQALFLGLPGNPVSTIVTYLLIAKPALLFLAGSTIPDEVFRFEAQLVTDLRHSPGREEYQRGSLTEQAGRLVVSVNGEQSSNRLASFANAACLIRIPKASGDLYAGDLVEVYPLTGLLG